MELTMKILALDIGKYNTMCCLYDTVKKAAVFCVAETTHDSLDKILRLRFPEAKLVVMEACGPAGWITDLCAKLKFKTLVCSTNEEAWKWTNVKRKTDRDDALKLAKMAAMNSLKPVHIPSPDQRQFRSLVKYRKTLDQRINRVKNTIRSLFVNQGISIGRGFKAWTVEGLEQIGKFRIPMAECTQNEFWKGELDLELTQLADLTKHLSDVEKRLEEIAAKDPRIQRVMTIPGVGRKTAEAIVAAIDDPHRFANGRQVSAYFGLVPRQFQSGETNRHGRITKRGSALVRAILIECGWCALRYNEWAKAVYERVSGKQKTRRKKAIVAVARKIAVVAWALLRDETSWDSATMFEKTTSFRRRRRVSSTDQKQEPEQTQKEAQEQPQDTQRPATRRAKSLGKGAQRTNAKAAKCKPRPITNTNKHRSHVAPSKADKASASPRSHDKRTVTTVTAKPKAGSKKPSQSKSPAASNANRKTLATAKRR
jgi:transposase